MITRTDIYFMLAMFALAVALQWGLFLDGFYSISWDESGRVLDAQRWFREGGFFYEHDWLPGYRMLVGSLLHLHYDLFITPRVVSFFFGLVAIAATGWLAHELFQSRPLSRLTLLLVTLFSQRIALALSPLSSIIFGALVVLSFAACLRWLSRGNRWSLCVFVVGFAAAGLIRREAWFMAAFVWLLMIVIRGRRELQLTLTELVLAGLIMGGFPVLWLWLHLVHEVTSLTILVEPQVWQYSLRELFVRNPLVQFPLINAPGLNLLGLISLVSLWRNHQGARVLSLTAGGALLAIGAVMFMSGFAQTGPPWRMTTVWGLLLVPFTAHALWCLLPGALPLRWAPLVRALAVIIVCTASLNHLLVIKRSAHWAFPEYEREAGQYLEPLIDSGRARVLIESYDFYNLNIVTATNNPEAFDFNSVPLMPEVRPAWLDVERGIDADLLASMHIRYLMFRREDNVELLEASLLTERQREFGPWVLYRLSVPVGE